MGKSNGLAHRHTCEKSLSSPLPEHVARSPNNRRNYSPKCPNNWPWTCRGTDFRLTRRRLRRRLWSYHVYRRIHNNFGRRRTGYRDLSATAPKSARFGFSNHAHQGKAKNQQRRHNSPTHGTPPRCETKQTNKQNKQTQKRGTVHVDTPTVIGCRAALQNRHVRGPSKWTLDRLWVKRAYHYTLRFLFCCC